MNSEQFENTSSAFDHELNEALVNANIETGYEEFLAIFDRFYSERPTGEKFGQHSGLGLSISRQIVAALRGQISAENRRDVSGKMVGARFVVRLPKA